MFNSRSKAELLQLHGLIDKGIPLPPGGLDRLNELEWRQTSWTWQWQLYRFTCFVQNRLGYDSPLNG